MRCMALGNAVDSCEYCLSMPGNKELEARRRNNMTWGEL